MAKIEGPDQAKGWIVAMAACIINTMLSGISRGTGIFYVALIDDYGVSRMEANMPFTMRNCVRNLAGPLVGIIGERFGVRAVTVIGSLLATLGIVLCSIAPDVVWITVFWGGFHGLGVALANTLFQVTVNQYFVKHRATAAGIALSGACVGSFVFPITLEMFLNSFGLGGAFLLTGGLIMQAVPASCMLKEPSWLRSKDSTKISTETVKEKVKLDTIQETTCGQSNGRKENIADEGKEKSNYSDNSKRHSDEFVVKVKNPSNRTKSGVDNLSYVGSTTNLRNKELQGIIGRSKRTRTVSAGEVSVTVPVEKYSNTTSKNRSTLQCLVKVYTNPMFYMISVSLAAFALLFDPLTTIIVDYIKDKGLDDHVGKYLISILALGDLAGRLCLGWVTDKDYLSLPKFILLNHILQGICFVIFPLFNSFEALMGISIVYGITAGATIVMFPLLVGKYLANEQSMAIGCIAFFAGIMAFTITPLIGHFRDTVGSYDGMFFITGGVSILMGFLWLLEPCLMKISNDKSSASGS